MRRLIAALILCAAPAVFAQTAGQDIKDAGRDVKDAAKKTGKATEDDQEGCQERQENYAQSGRQSGRENQG